MKIGRKKDKSSRKSRNVISGRGRVTSTNYYRPKNQTIITAKKEDKTPKNKKFSFSSVINILIAVVIVGLLLFSTTLSSNVDIRLNDNDFRYRGVAEYAEAAREIVSRTLTNRSKLTFRSTNFEQEMIEQFPEIRLIDAILPIAGRNISASIRVAEPLANVSSGSDNGVIDSSGVLVSSSSSRLNNGLLNLRFATPQSNFVTGSRVITGDEVYLLKQIQREFSLLRLDNTDILSVEEVLFNVADGQIEIQLKEVGFFIKLSSYGDPDEQVGAIKATLVQLDREGELPSKYLDVRVPGRAFVL